MLLGFTHLLDHDLLGSLSRDAAEVLLGLEREDNLGAKLSVTLDALRVFKENMLLGVIARKLSFSDDLLFVEMMRVLERRLFTVLGEADQPLVNDGLHLFKRDR